MKLYIFADCRCSAHSDADPARIKNVLSLVAETTDTRDLVVALYLAPKGTWYGGTAYVRHWVLPQHFRPRRGKWGKFGHHPQPPDLPAKFRLIRLLLPLGSSSYPLTEEDRYRWVHRFASFADHLAHLFAHELHHYRRHHLGLHPREGEHGANRWALAHIVAQGFQVTSERLPARQRRKRKPSKIALASVLNPLDFVSAKNILRGQAHWQDVAQHLLLNISKKAREEYMAAKMSQFETLRSLPTGTTLLVSFDPKQRYNGSQATLIRAMRKNSLRIVIRTFDGKLWRWPLAWLEVVG